jgi:predicted DNA-binding transcriptional regulator YafY
MKKGVNTMSHASLRRIYDLDRMIRLGELHNAEDAAERFEVTRRTIERDLDTLRTDLGVEVYFNHGEGRYEYINKPVVTLPGQGLNEREIAIVLIAERALRQFTGASFQDEIHPVFNKLLNPIRHNKEAMENIRDLCSSVYFHRPLEPIRDLRNEFSVVLDAIMQRRRLSMTYRSAKRDKDERREIEPYVLLNSGGDWYIVGLCRRSKQIKVFSLLRVFEPKIEEHYFIIPDSFKIADYLSAGFGRVYGEKADTVRLRIRPPLSARISTSKWHSSQKIKKLKNGEVELQIKCPVTDTLVRWVLQMGECVKIEGPASLKLIAREKAEKFLANQL